MNQIYRWGAVILVSGLALAITPSLVLAQTPTGPSQVPPPFDQATETAQQVLGTHLIDPPTAIGRLLLAAVLGAIIAYRRRLMVE